MKKLKKLNIEFKFSFFNLLYLLLGNLFFSLSLNLFLVGNDIAAGGFSGIAIIVNHFRTVPIGLFVFILTIPLIIWAAFVKNLNFIISTLLCTGVYSIFMDIFAFLPNVTENKLIAGICGGLLYGIGAVFLLRANASTGGTDLLTKLLLTKRRDLSLGTMYIIVDGLVVIASAIVFKNIETAIYAVVCLGVTSYVTDLLINGFNSASVFYIITPRPAEELSEIIFKYMDRGTTCIKGRGMYGQSEQNILMVVVKPREVYKLKDIIRVYAPESFAFLSHASQVLGFGFPLLEAGDTGAGDKRKKDS